MTVGASIIISIPILNVLTDNDSDHVDCRTICRRMMHYQRDDMPLEDTPLSSNRWTAMPNESPRPRDNKTMAPVIKGLRDYKTCNANCNGSRIIIRISIAGYSAPSIEKLN